MKLKTILLSAMTLVSTSVIADSCAQPDTFYTKSGRALVITPIKHASMRIQYDGKEIQIDPVTQLPPATDYTAFPKADYIFVTHEHFDHCDKKAVEQLTKDGTIVIANANSAAIIGQGMVMKNGDSKTISISNTDGTSRTSTPSEPASKASATEMAVDAVPAYNNSADKQQFHPKGRDNGYVLTIDGLRIYIAGDTEDIEEMSQLKDIDVAFLPCNLPYTMTPEQCAKAAKMFMPKVLYPYHFSETKIERVKELLSGTGIDVRLRNFK